ncbi:hypothetical protein VPH35_021301 [Triticum aestivum]
MELDLNDYLATGWRCSAHAIGPGVFVVCFPNPRAVAQICYVGKVTLKTSGAVIHAKQWLSAIGAKGVMEVAWVRISDVPLDKRSERNLAYIDAATLHRPSSARVRLGCRNVDAIHVVAEAVLGGNFYDFFYEVDQVLVRDPDREKNAVHISSGYENKNNIGSTSQSNPGATQGGLPTRLGGKSPPIPHGGKTDPIRDSQESVESDESLHTTLFLETMAQELERGEKVVEVDTINDANLKVITDYMVESPETRVENANKMEKIEEKAMAVAKKRDIEGLMNGDDRETMERRAKMLKTNASTLMRICAAPGDARQG